MEDNVFSEEQRAMAHRILTSARRELARKYPYLERAIFYHKMEATSKTDFMGADYVTIYYNPVGVIEQFQKKRRRIKHTLLHSVLHCMCHHPSMEFSDKALFDAAADASVNAMLDTLFVREDGRPRQSFRNLAEDCKGISAPHIYKAVKEDRKLKHRVRSLYEAYHIDDHRMWREENSDDFSPSADGNRGKSGAEQTDGISPAPAGQRLRKTQSPTGHRYGSHRSINVAKASATAAEISLPILLPPTDSAGWTISPILKNSFGTR